MLERPPSGTIPDAPGSYQFLDGEGRVLYVGKAKSLRHRLNSYFGRRDRVATRTAQMLDAAETVEWIRVANELEALMLEFSLIQEHSPRFNVDLKDDKSYPLLALTLDHEWPRAMVVRGRRRKGVRYFGPYGSAGAIRETLDLLLRTFPVRTCSDNKLEEHRRLGRPCLLFHIEKCAGPCVDEVTKGDYEALLEDLGRVLAGDTDDVEARLEERMAVASEALEFEAAARWRDRLGSVRKVAERQQMVGTRNESLDVFGIFGDELEAAVQVFYVRRGRVVGRKGFVVERIEDLAPGDLAGEVLAAHYRGDPPQGIPREVLLPDLPTEADLLAEWLGGLRDALGLSEAPLRIECFDMSHLQGTDYVGSMVVVEDGLVRKQEYRRFRVRGVPGNDDYAAMEEVLTRRLRAYLEEAALPVAERPGRFAYPPQLLLVDGGKGQLGVAERVVAGLGLGDRIPVAALAKRFEEVFVPGREASILLPRGSEALYLLQRIRDESHRFAVAYHRQLRSRRMTGSVLDGIPGLGPTRRARLVKELGGVRKVQAASLEDLRALSWLPDAVAEAVHSTAHRPATRSDPDGGPA